MMDFLKIVAAFFVALVILAALGLFWLRFKVKRWVSSMTSQLAQGLGVTGPASAFLIPLRIRLEQTHDADWVEHDVLEEFTDELTNLGFSVIADYDIEPAGISARGLVHGGESMYAVIYQHPLMAQDTWVDLFARYSDGTSVTFTSSPHAQLLDSPPGNSKQSFVEASPSQLFERMQQALPAGARNPVSADSFAEDFVQYYADEMDWRIARGGPSRPEIERAAEQAGTQVDEAMIGQIQQLWQAHVAQHHETQLRDHFLEHSELSAADYQRLRDRLIFIHDGMTAEMLVDSIDALIPYPEDEAVEDDEDVAGAEEEYEALMLRINRIVESKPPREAFAALIKILPDPSQIEHLQTVDDPVPADVYVGPDPW